MRRISKTDELGPRKLTHVIYIRALDFDSAERGVRLAKCIPEQRPAIIRLAARALARCAEETQCAQQDQPTKCTGSRRLARMT
jgi:hypothetical protein